MDKNESESVEKIQKPIFWKGWKGWTAKLSAIAAVVIAIFAGLNYIKPNVIHKEKPDIVATVRYKRIELPESYKEALRNMGHPSYISSDNQIAAFVQKLPEKSRNTALEVISGYIDSHIPYYLNERNRLIKGWLDIDVVNNSDMTVFDVVVEIPGFIAVTEVYSNSNGRVEIKEKRDFVKLGDLRPRDEVNIQAWLYDRFLSSEKVKLTHKDGIGKVLKE